MNQQQENEAGQQQAETKDKEIFDENLDVLKIFLFFTIVELFLITLKFTLR